MLLSYLKPQVVDEERRELNPCCHNNPYFFFLCRCERAEAHGLHGTAGDMGPGQPLQGLQRLPGGRGETGRWRHGDCGHGHEAARHVHRQAALLSGRENMLSTS